MPSRPSPSSSVQEARQRLADRLADIRTEAGLTGQAVADAAGWHKSKVSRIEHAVQSATADDIRAWCAACDADAQIPDLVAQLRAAEGAYVEWRRLQRGGLKRLQESYMPLYEQTRRFRSYQSNVVPGFLQTAAYAEAMLARFAARTGARPEVTEAAEARVERARLLHTDRTFGFLVEEAVLRQGLGGPAVMVEQLMYLAEVTAGALPAVTLGVISGSPDRPVWTLEGFMIYDDSSAHVELLAARITITTPGELAMYEAAYERLSAMAVYGSTARELITAALREL